MTVADCSWCVYKVNEFSRNDPQCYVLSITHFTDVTMYYPNSK